MEAPIKEEMNDAKYKPTYIKKHFPEFYEYLLSTYPNITFQEKLYWYFHGITEPPKCVVCGQHTKFINGSKGYHLHCSVKCSNEDCSKVDKMKQTNLVRYGHECNLWNNEIRENITKNNIKKYGVAIATQNPEIKEKIKQTNLRKYGVECGLQNEKIREKSKQTMLERYGVDWAIKSEKIKNKVRQTMLERYGVDWMTKSDEIKEKIKQTNLERYGVEYGLQDEGIREKSKQTMLERYGVEYSMQCESVKEKTKQTFKKKYGVEHVILNRDIKEKIRQTNLQRYRVDWACQREEARNFTNDSIPNKTFAQLLDKNHIEYEREFNIKSKSYDFKIGDILLEIDPFATHNSTWGLYNNPKPVSYHRDKTLLAQECGFRCIHVWDWDEYDKIINMLKPKNTLYAKMCEIKEVSQEDCDEFLQKYHIQNSCKGQNIRFGLYYKDTLVEIMTFGKPRYNHNYEYELLRLCVHADHIVVGGSSRLFLYFTNHYNPSSVISYCDNAKFGGRVYEQLGFTLKRTSPPVKHWYDGKIHITDNLLRQRGFDQLFGTAFGKGTSNEELMIQHKFVEIYDAGQNTYIWKKS